MENKIKELIEKYDDKRLEEPDYYFQWEEIIEDLKSLLEFKQNNELHVSLLEIDNPVEFRKEVENLYLKHSEVHRALRRKIMGLDEKSNALEGFPHAKDKTIGKRSKKSH